MKWERSCRTRLRADCRRFLCLLDIRDEGARRPAARAGHSRHAIDQRGGHQSLVHGGFSRDRLALQLVAAFRGWQEPAAPYLLTRSVLYLGGTILVTMLFNVPRNNALAAVSPPRRKRLRYGRTIFPPGRSGITCGLSRRSQHRRSSSLRCGFGRSVRCSFLPFNCDRRASVARPPLWALGAKLRIRFPPRSASISENNSVTKSMNNRTRGIRR